MGNPANLDELIKDAMHKIEIVWMCVMMYYSKQNALPFIQHIHYSTWSILPECCVCVVSLFVSMWIKR